MSNIKYLRLLGCTGSAAFAIYGLLVHAYPVFFVNALIAFTHLHYLIKLSRKTDYFTIDSSLKKNDFLIEHFLNFFQNDIKKFFPDFSLAAISAPQFIVTFRDLVPVGLFIYEEQTDGTVRIHLDYVRTEYRDSKNGQYLLSQIKSILKSKGFRSLVSYTVVPAHKAYLQKLGFEQDQNDATLFKKNLDDGHLL